MNSKESIQDKEQHPAPTPADPVIDIVSLVKSFGTQPVLTGVSLQLHDGENLVVLGKSGSGKSVLIKCIVRLMEPESGTIRVLGQDVGNLNYRHLAELRKKIGFLFQNGALYDSMTVRQNLEFPLLRSGTRLSAGQMLDKVHEALEQVGLTDTIDLMPSQLSGGMRKRISLARTIVVGPQIILYDEPTTGLDPETSDEISALINDVQRRYHTSSIIITHDIRCAAATADRLVMLREGAVHKEGTLKEFEDSTDVKIRSFFHDLTTNLNSGISPS